MSSSLSSSILWLRQSSWVVGNMGEEETGRFLQSDLTAISLGNSSIVMSVQFFDKRHKSVRTFHVHMVLPLFGNLMVFVAPVSHLSRTESMERTAGFDPGLDWSDVLLLCFFFLIVLSGDIQIAWRHPSPLQVLLWKASELLYWQQTNWMFLVIFFSVGIIYMYGLCGVMSIGSRLEFEFQSRLLHWLAQKYPWKKYESFFLSRLWVK